MAYMYERRSRSPPPYHEPYPPALDPRYAYRDRREGGYPPRRPNHQLQEAEPNNVLGVFGLSIRTRERDLEDEFMRYGDVDKVVIVYDQRTDRSRGFGFVTMRTIEDAQRAIEKLNGLNLHGRNIRVDFSATQKPHAPTPGQYMGVKRPAYEDNRYDRGGYDRGGRGYDDRGGRGGYDRGGRGYDSRGAGAYDSRSRGYDRPPRDDRDRYADRDDRRGYDERPRRDDYDSRRRSPSPRRRYSASPDRGSRAARDYDAGSASAAAPVESSRY
ncbi:uncharacterized protein I303_104381 [Kwoniella dejecticola CBS 10117]|uniref:RRM domain-containing protein n=1 Tax=Kwoniella dejecticola CBS 10117 TaxID=1296121 RepID=A0A1A6A5G8_9TREE|nr:uncharacterized protein I303_04642 [Kwoniella dejecticola CBS 10117]OBR85307.1 hypothetical protein I303_04642 [Kwoniella dejecticola CBS 10117]